MVKRLQRLGCLLVISIIVLGIPICMIANTDVERPKALLDWNIKTSKNTYYPGEPVLLTLTIKNAGQQEEKIDFGADGIEAFSMEIHDSNKIVAKAGNIKREGLGRLGTVTAPPGQMAQKSIVLNQWCSTLIPPGQYRVICHVEYRLYSEDTKIPGTEHGFKAGPLHKIELGLDINIIKMDITEFKKILEQLSEQAFSIKTKKDLATRGIARESLVFTESELAVPYQLGVLTADPYTRLKRDAINSLVRSKTLEAATGLMEIVEDPTHTDVKRDLVDAVYRIRETGKPDIVKATEEFVAKYKRPVLAKPID